MKQIVIKFGLLASCLLILMQLGQYSMMTHKLSDEVFFTLFAILFLAFGFVISRFIQNKANNEDKNPDLGAKPIDLDKIQKLKISKREYEVLELINLGHSNQEIANLLYISESTVKSHVSSLLSKLNAKRRTQAIKSAKELQIL